MMFWITIAGRPRLGMRPTQFPSFHYILHPCLTPLRADMHQDGRPEGRPYGSPYTSSCISLISIPEHPLSHEASAASACSATGPADHQALQEPTEVYSNILSTVILAIQLSTGCLAEQPTSRSSSFHPVVL
jgi:hypothetical protein